MTFFFNTDTDARGWWFSRSEDNYYNPLDYTDSSKGFEDSLQCIIQTFKSRYNQQQDKITLQYHYS